MRELYGSTFFGPQYLPIKPVSYELLDKIKPRLSENVTIGADLRTIWLATNSIDNGDSTAQGLSDGLSTNTGTVAQMEGNLYLEVRPSEHFMLYFSRGVADASGRMEVYGLANLSGFKAWLKGGQFQENYGYRFADHTSYVRTGLWSGYDGGAFTPPTPPHYGAGLEAGTRMFGFDASASYTAAQSNIPLDRDQQKRFIGRVFGQKRLPFAKKFIVSGGLSGLASPKKARDPEIGFPGAASKELAWGGFGGLAFEGLHNRMGTAEGASNFGWLATSLLFEYDRKDWTPFWAPFPVTSAYSTAQLEIMVYQGVWLLGAYDWLDNAETSNIAGEAERTTIGASTFLLPWVELSLRHRLYSTVEAPPTAGALQPRNKQQLECQLHLFF
ncbi:MAG: hypothetical protein H6506_03910 [Calditrichaeota bacterium]|nr:hypothetical protein [Calditrichota bacterium]MCB9391779.1 hypothetical protein [Calditrichota bacterium]